MQKFSHVLDLPIFNLRNQRVILDKDIAAIYDVETKRVNEAVRRNPDRFPEEFCFQLNREEFINLKSQFATSSSDHGGTRKLPYVFTEHGAVMLSAVLNSPKAVTMSLYVIRAFVRMREELVGNLAWQKRLAEIEKNLLQHDSALRDIYAKIRPLLLPPPLISKPPIGFKG